MLAYSHTRITHLLQEGLIPYCRFQLQRIPELLRPLYLHHVGKLRSYVLLYDFGANELAVSDLRCSMLRSLSDMLPSMRWRAIGVIEGYVFSVREQLLRRLGVSFQELA